MLGMVGLVLCGLAFISNIVGIAIPYWFYCSTLVQMDLVSVYYGLWRMCSDRRVFGHSISLCVSIDETFKDFRKFCP